MADTEIVRLLDGLIARVSQLEHSEGRLTLTSARTYYVNPSTGSDTAYDGLSSSVSGSAGPFATIQKAVDVVSNSLDLNQYQATIQLANGTYTLTTSVYLKSCVGMGLYLPIIQGDTTTPSNVLVTGTSINLFNNPYPGSSWIIKGVKMTTTTSGTAIISSMGAVVGFGQVDFGACASFHMYSSFSGLIYATAAYSITGGAGVHHYADSGGAISVQGVTVTLTGTPNFTTAFAYGGAGGLGNVRVNGNTYTGAATGTRYVVNRNGVVFVNGGGATYLPGDVAGSTATGGQYG